MSEEVSTAHLFLLVVDANDADDESSGNEAEECPAVEPDEDSSSEESAVELSARGGSSSENNLSQPPLATLLTLPLDSPASPALDVVLDDGYNMEGYDQQSGIISDWYATKEEVRSLAFNIID